MEQQKSNPTQTSFDEEHRITRLTETTGCSKEKAKEAMAQGDGSLLSAVLYLEDKGHVRVAEGEGFHSTKEIPPPPPHIPLSPTLNEEHSSFFRVCREELFQNYLELWYKDQFLGHIPVGCFMFLMPVTYGSVFPLLVVPMFLGVYYRFSHTGSFLAEFNPVMKRMTKTLYGLVRKLWKGKTSKEEKDINKPKNPNSEQKA